MSFALANDRGAFDKKELFDHQLVGSPPFSLAVGCNAAAGSVRTRKRTLLAPPSLDQVGCGASEHRPLFHAAAELLRIDLVVRKLRTSLVAPRPGRNGIRGRLHTTWRSLPGSGCRRLTVPIPRPAGSTVAPRSRWAASADSLNRFDPVLRMRWLSRSGRQRYIHLRSYELPKGGRW